MGYRIATINNLPSVFNCYFFLVGEYRNHSVINNFFREDFNIIADSIGDQAAIVQKTDNSRIEDELQGALTSFISSNSDVANYFKEIFMCYPGLLILSEHPQLITDKSMFLYIPFSVLDETYKNTNDLLFDLVSFAKSNNIDIVKKTSKRFSIIKGVSVALNLGIFTVNFDISNMKRNRKIR